MNNKANITDEKLGKLIQSLNGDDEKYITTAINIRQSIEKIIPGFRRMKEIVDKEKLKLGQIEAVNPEQAQTVRAIHNAQNNEGRYEKIANEIDKRNDSLNIIMDRFKQKGFGEILDMTSTDLINLGDKLRVELDTRKRIDSLEINFENYEPESKTKNRIKNKI